LGAQSISASVDLGQRLLQASNPLFEPLQKGAVDLPARNRGVTSTQAGLGLLAQRCLQGGELLMSASSCCRRAAVSFNSSSKNKVGLLGRHLLRGFGTNQTHWVDQIRSKATNCV